MQTEALKCMLRYAQLIRIMGERGFAIFYKVFVDEAINTSAVRTYLDNQVSYKNTDPRLGLSF